MGALLYMLLFLAQFSSIYCTLPKIYFKCHITDTACLTKLIQLNAPALTSGIEELGTEVLDPLTIDKIDVDIGGLELNAYNIVSRGFKNGILDSATVDPVTKLFTMLFHADLNDNAIYNSSGTLLGFPFNGDGCTRFELKKLQILLIIPFDIVNGSNGKDVIELKNFQYLFDVDSVQCEFTNLYNENKKQLDTLHQFIDNNCRLITLLYGRPYLDAVNEKIFNVMRTVFLAIPMEDIFYKY